MTATGSAERSVLDRIVAPAGRADRVLHVEHVPPRVAQTVDWPEWAPPLLVDRLRLRGVDRPWSHQVAAADHAWHGRPVVLATATASGKSLGYLLRCCPDFSRATRLRSTSHRRRRWPPTSCARSASCR